MYKSISFKKKLLATSIASIAMAGMSTFAYAEDKAAATNDEEIVVTGIKASLERAMDIKKNAVGVVDAISAEDIGKMPDANLAESLQRISGVSIDRSGGEGSKVTVRGLSGDYNLVTLNGRQMPASTVGNNGANASRSFDFANLASEGVAGVEVYKTGRSDVDSGGMGALINIITPHPLKHPGLKASVGVKAVDDLSSEKSSVTPEISGLFSDTFADDRIGVAVTGSYQKRKYGDSQVNVAGWFEHSPTAGDWATIPASAQPTDKTVTYGHPVSIGYSHSEADRTRVNGQVTLQFKPVDQLTITADYLYVDQKTERENHTAGMWFNRNDPIAVTWSNTNPTYPLVYSEMTGKNHDLDVGSTIQNRRSNLKSAGLNLAWDATDNLHLEFDGHNSTSHAGPGSGDTAHWGTESSFEAAYLHNYKVAVDFSKAFPKLSVVSYTDPVTDPVTNVTTPAVPDNGTLPNATKMSLTGNTFKNSIQDGAIDEYQLKGEYKFDDGILKSIKLGGSKMENKNISFWVGHNMENQGSWGGVGQPGDLDSSYWSIDHWSNHFNNSGASAKDFQNAFVTFNLNKVATAAASAKWYGSKTYSDQSPCPLSYCATFLPDLGSDGFSDRRATEESDTGFLLANFGGEYAGMPVHLSTGLRYEHTIVRTKSFLGAYTPYIDWDTGNEYSLVAAGKKDYFSSKGSYDELLPSLDYDMGLTETIKARASYSKTIARPNYDDIRGGLELGGHPRYAQGSGGSGNPNLKPLLSNNYDLSFEWYYGDASYVSVGYFKKDIKDFIGSAPTMVTNSGYHTPVSGDRWNAAVAANHGAVDPAQIATYIGDHYSDTVVKDAQGKVLHVHAVAGDPILPFEITQPVNNKAVRINGVEVAVQHTFGESGFGVMANGTVVDSDVNFKDKSLGEQFAIYGLSNSYNLVGFYDKDRWQARVAYNWRDKFLAAKGDASSGNNPRYTDAYGQFDVTGSFKVTDSLTVSLEGLNVLGATTRQYGRDWHELLNYTETGARYNLGARYTF